ncbi:MAG: hypothetical protein K2N71_01835 [Oscillospiraceae bacterium]|nr:hypothetical protein [Oscillospiraceae bacterium]
MIETLDLERKIREEQFFDEETVLNNKSPDINIMINKYIAEKDIPHTEIIRRLNVERSYGYQLLNGKRIPTRVQIIKIGLMLKLDFKELQQMLKIAGKEILYAKNLTDARVIYSVERGLDYEKACEFIWEE